MMGGRDVGKDTGVGFHSSKLDLCSAVTVSMDEMKSSAKGLTKGCIGWCGYCRN